MTTETKAKETKMAKIRHVSFDGFMSDSDVELVTSLSRTTRWRLARQGKFPKKVQISAGRAADSGPAIKQWLDERLGKVEETVE